MTSQITKITVNGTESGHIKFAPVIKMWAAVAYIGTSCKSVGCFETREQAEAAVTASVSA